MNFVPGRIVVGADGPEFQSEALRLPLGSYPFFGKPEHGVPVELGVRPEHIIVAPEAPHDVAVEMTEPTGSDLLARTRLGDRLLSIRLPAETKLDTGDRLWVCSPTTD